MKILMLTEVLKLGGGETVAINLANALADRGIRVWCAAADGPLRNRLSDSVCFLPIPEYSLVAIRDVAVALRRVIDDVRPDIVHSHGSTLSLLAGRAIRSIRATIPNILTRHNPFSRLPPLFACMLLSRYCDHVIVLSPLARQQFQNPFFSEHQISVIPNFIDVDAITSHLASLDRLSIRASLSIPDTMPIITIVGRLIPGKRCNIFINAVALAAQQLKQRLCGLIVGDGPLRQELEQQAQRQSGWADFHFLGYQSDVFQFLAISEAFLFPTASEVLPLVLLEAAVAGVPVVCSDIPQNRNIVEHQRTGIIAAGNEKDFSDAVVRLLTNKTFAKELAHNARKQVQQRFDKKVVLDATIALYQRLLGGKRKP